MKEMLFREILPKVSKPSRYTGGEFNIIIKDWERAKTKMVLAFPDVYEIGMSHVGSKILYGLVNERTEHVLERTYTPWPDMESIMRGRNIPLYSLESFKPWLDFDLIGFSMLYELAITNVLNMLDLAGIPIYSNDRNDSHPLIIAGGPVIYNPEPFAAFFDIMVIGDGEEVIIEILDLIAANRDLSRNQLLLDLSKLAGVYVPSLYEVSYYDNEKKIKRDKLYPNIQDRICKRTVKDLDQTFFSNNPLVPNLGVVHDRAVIEVMRGCQRGCRFCQAGMVYRPVRERSISNLEIMAEKQLRATGYDEISLASLSTLDYSGVQKLVESLVEAHAKNGIGVSLPSLRVDRFSIDLAKQVQKVRKTTLTLAPEAGTQRLRDVINKNITAEQLFSAVESAFKSGWLSLKLYFMIGLPSETEEDLEGIINLLAEVKKIGNRYSKRPVEIRAAISCFVPKAHTPFQWQRQSSSEELAAKKDFLSRFRSKNVKLSYHDSPTCYLEGIITRGDRRLAQVIHRAWELGCRFDGWSEHFNFELWQQAFRETGVDGDYYVYRLRSYNEDLPWDFIDIGIDKSFLQAEMERARNAETTGDCRYQGCNDCGLCTAHDVKLDIKGL